MKEATGAPTVPTLTYEHRKELIEELKQLLGPKVAKADDKLREAQRRRIEELRAQTSLDSTVVAVYSNMREVQKLKMRLEAAEKTLARHKEWCGEEGWYIAADGLRTPVPGGAIYQGIQEDLTEEAEAFAATLEVRAKLLRSLRLAETLPEARAIFHEAEAC